MHKDLFQIANKQLGPGNPCYVIAEAGGNANSDLDLALRLVREAHQAGADAIKFQTYKADTLVTRKASKYWVDTMEEWERGDTPIGEQYDEFKLLDGLNFEDYRQIKQECDTLGITFFSTPFDLTSVDMLAELGMEVYKIASADITYTGLLQAVARKGKPIFLSTGASTLDEVREAVDAIRTAGNNQIALMQCTLHYPSHFDEVNLNAMYTLQEAFPDCAIGLSDHSLGIIVPIIAASHGAQLIEKHYTIDKTLDKSTDHFISVDPVELKEMVDTIRLTPQIMGSAEKEPHPSEKLARMYARRSITATVPIKKGEMITNNNTLIRRPGTGIQPVHYDAVLGRIAVCDIEAEIPLQWDMLSG